MQTAVARRPSKQLQRVLCLALAANVWIEGPGSCSAVAFLARGRSLKEREGAIAEQAKEDECRKQREQEEEERQKQREQEEREAKRVEREQEKKTQREKEEQEREARERLRVLEEEALAKKRHELKRPLNRFEMRRERRRVRSAFSGGVELPGMQDFPEQLRPEVKAQLDDAVRFFSETMRVPAVLLASSALGSLFIPGWAMDKEENPSRMFRTLRRFYFLLTVATFCLELTAVLVTSNAHAQLLELGRAGLTLEPTSLDLIMTYLEFDYLCCSMSFMGGVIAFMLATLCRMLAVFRYSRTLRVPQEQRLSAAMASMLVATLLWWVHLINVRLTEFDNLGEMALRLMRLLLARLLLSQLGPVGISAVASFAVSTCLAVRAVFVEDPIPATTESEPVVPKHVA
eukprot:TRINITY_DN9787_c0_g1_i1.p1 TRINITY_DN9787_c0_g1~~TRINITY_DN9787_c0_g1_i1.p1  ORF type:complete len:417 (+),score=76.16 TRINITY_DN9787_c0_g1_i1:47-1252(+)